MAALKFNPLTKLISLSVLIAVGFLNIVLSCALYDNWYPITVVIVFLLAPIPNALASCLKNNNYNYGYNSYYDDNGGEAPGVGFLRFMTGSLVSSGGLLPFILFHNNVINFNSFLLSLSGGFIIYLSIVLFGMGFKNDDDDDYDGYDF